MRSRARPRDGRMDDGRKGHIEFYVLLVGEPYGTSWAVYSFSEGYLSISPNQWSPTDCSKDTQVTIIRSERIGKWRHWRPIYPNSQAAVETVIRKAVEQGKLEGRPQKQFEILSADFILDTDMNAYMLEFNMRGSKRPAADSESPAPALRRGAQRGRAPGAGGHPRLRAPHDRCELEPCPLRQAAADGSLAAAYRSLEVHATPCSPVPFTEPPLCGRGPGSRSPFFFRLGQRSRVQRSGMGSRERSAARVARARATTLRASQCARDNVTAAQYYPYFPTSFLLANVEISQLKWAEPLSEPGRKTRSAKRNVRRLPQPGASGFPRDSS